MLALPILHANEQEGQVPGKGTAVQISGVGEGGNIVFPKPSFFYTCIRTNRQTNVNGAVQRMIKCAKKLNRT